MRIRYCGSCGKYTVEDVCPCGKKTRLKSPPKFKPDDKYEHYRREMRWNSSSKGQKNLN